jgi:hypothetical protein
MSLEKLVLSEEDRGFLDAVPVLRGVIGDLFEDFPSTSSEGVEPSAPRAQERGGPQNPGYTGNATQPDNPSLFSTSLFTTKLQVGGLGGINGADDNIHSPAPAAEERIPSTVLTDCSSSPTKQVKKAVLRTPAVPKPTAPSVQAAPKIRTLREVIEDGSNGERYDRLKKYLNQYPLSERQRGEAVILANSFYCLKTCVLYADEKLLFKIIDLKLIHAKKLKQQVKEVVQTCINTRKTNLSRALLARVNKKELGARSKTSKGQSKRPHQRDGHIIEHYIDINKAIELIVEEVFSREDLDMPDFILREARRNLIEEIHSKIGEVPAESIKLEGTDLSEKITGIINEWIVETRKGYGEFKEGFIKTSVETFFRGRSEIGGGNRAQDLQKLELYRKKLNNYLFDEFDKIAGKITAKTNEEFGAAFQEYVTNILEERLILLESEESGRSESPESGSSPSAISAMKENTQKEIRLETLARAAFGSFIADAAEKDKCFYTKLREPVIARLLSSMRRERLTDMVELKSRCKTFCEAMKAFEDKKTGKSEQPSESRSITPSPKARCSNAKQLADFVESTVDYFLSEWYQEQGEEDIRRIATELNKTIRPMEIPISKQCKRLYLCKNSLLRSLLEIVIPSDPDVKDLFDPKKDTENNKERMKLLLLNLHNMGGMLAKELLEEVCPKETEEFKNRLWEILFKQGIRDKAKAEKLYKSILKEESNHVAIAGMEGAVGDNTPGADATASPTAMLLTNSHPTVSIPSHVAEQGAVDRGALAAIPQGAQFGHP